jgi:hypothetical protein
MDPKVVKFFRDNARAAENLYGKTGRMIEELKSRSLPLKQVKLPKGAIAF